MDDSDLEVNEARLDWLHTKARRQQSDTVTAEVEKGFGLLTLEMEVPYERDVAAGESTAQGIGNIDLGARYPFYQFVSANGFFDTTFGAAVEVGVPVNSAVSKNTEFVPKIFNDLRVGDHFTLQSIFGYSTLFGGGDDGGLQTFESGFVFGYTIQHSELPLPGVQQFIPMFELAGETADEQGGFRPNQPRLEMPASASTSKPSDGCSHGWDLDLSFRLNNNARADVHWGIVTSLVFEY